jgi:hypothetical protein
MSIGTPNPDLSAEAVMALKHAILSLRPYEAQDARIAGMISKLDALATAPRDQVSKHEGALAAELEEILKAEAAPLGTRERHELNKRSAPAYREYLRQVSPGTVAALERRAADPVAVAKREGQDAYAQLRDAARELQRRDASLTESAALEQAINQNPDLARSASAGARA